jgi:hypothetical protein
MKHDFASVATERLRGGAINDDKISRHMALGHGNNKTRALTKQEYHNFEILGSYQVFHVPRNVQIKTKACAQGSRDS